MTGTASIVAAPRPRARDLGIRLGSLEPGPLNAITDVAGVRVGQTTLIEGEGPLVVGKGPVRTGVTVVLPRAGNVVDEPVFAGWHRLNGNGEMTGLPWIEESGLLTTPIGLTNTHSVGVVRDALIAYEIARAGAGVDEIAWSLPVVAETYDGWLNDINGLHVKPEHVFAALDAAASGPVAEGGVGGGTGMIAHGFKGGIGTASRVVSEAEGAWTVGALVQANYGQRRLLRIDGVPVGAEIPVEEIPSHRSPPPQQPAGTGSIIVVLATDAPLLGDQCRRLAQRASLGIARMGGLGENSSGDIFIAFATGNTGLSGKLFARAPIEIRMLPADALTPLFEAAVDATEEAIVNALCAATTTTGVNGRTVHALPHDRLVEIMRRYGRLTA
jgi:D-aminopeptidase